MTNRPPPWVLALVGATATGKTAVGEWLAERLGADVVCADSRQVFRELSVGTGKPSPRELEARPHRLFDALSIGQRASAGWYGRAAREACRGVHDQGGVPLLVGGSGLYLRALMSGLSAEPPHDAVRRAALVAEAAQRGVAALHARLRTLDPEAAARVHPTDRQRVIRALEVVEASGRPLTWWRAQAAPPSLEAEWRVVELQIPADELRSRIGARTRRMFDGGLVEEAAALVANGLGPALRALRAVGYDEALELLQGTLDRAEAERRTNLRTYRLAKRQRTWFRHQLRAERVAATTDDPASLGAAVLAAFDLEAGG